eukprot:CAMPEP_0197869166 /NCGR_PEP_ID=MMETSP1438-20131217/45669_1 /TAXON_ID=1461541 /ORGANISM="Pterosperma sp., Strain CCMP1384" /LENGTH=61 /DNA_ID=CAMNT_0043487911 /DNA_START=607 /DNA_END=792 /DNA_ORIENTATION=+
MPIQPLSILVLFDVIWCDSSEGGSERKVDSHDDGITITEPLPLRTNMSRELWAHSPGCKPH